MHTLRKYIRAVAAFLLVNFLYATFIPTISYALTAGPTAPEATSFEPIDTTDMVNLQTGDFTYNIPLLEVPGPSGGYPLSLSYHAGIMPNEEASWVGLGWTLNPGAINRTVNGFADDFKSIENTNRFYWDGGERTTGEIGVTFGISGVVGATAGIAVGQDTYQGFGVGGFIGAGLGFNNKNSPVGINARLGVDPWGSYYASVGLNAGTGESEKRALSASIGVGVSTNFQSISPSGGLSVGTNSVQAGFNNRGLNASFVQQGISLATVDQSGSLSGAVGQANTQNSRTGIISTQSSNFVLPLPFVHLGLKKDRYWINQIENTDVNGTLYNPETASSDWHDYDNQAYDTYTLLDPSEPGGLAKNQDPDKVLGGSFPSHDHYSVTGQGIAGNIQPFIAKGYLHRQNSKEGDVYNSIHYSNGNHSNELAFRFIGDFSNRYLFEPPNFGTGPGALNFDFSNATAETTGDGLVNGMNGQKLAGSKSVEFLTNQEITTNDAKLGDVGFMENRSTGFIRANDDKIGAYVITNSAGVKYHYSLPVYALKEYQYSGKITGTDTYNEFTKPEPYAYTWLLTAVTGPDYVDRGTIGEFDEEDWGYWVEFDYGKWTNLYFWRNPGIGTSKDIDENFENVSSGSKEVYYLDAVRTKTHTAFFVKDIRHDAKSAVLNSPLIDGPNYSNEPFNAQVLEGGYIPKNVHIENKNFTVKPVSSLKLDRIVLLKNEDVSQQLTKVNPPPGYDFDPETGGLVYSTHNFSQVVSGGHIFAEAYEQHFSDNVLDIYDINASTVPLYFDSKAIRIIDFNTDYSLVPETANSFDSNLLKELNPSTDPANYPLHGKLTLKSVQFKGKGGADNIPAMKFGYDYESPVESGLEEIWYSSTTDTYVISDAEVAFVDNISKGDIVKFRQNDKWYYGYISLKSPVLNDGSLEWQVQLKIVGASTPSDGTIGQIQKTKNPPYQQEYYDEWGMYKPDFIASIASKNNHAARRTNVYDAGSKDVWSLRSVKTSSGAQISIDYESDQYNQVPLLQSSLLTISDIIDLGNGKFRISLLEKNSPLEGLSLQEVQSLAMDAALLWTFPYLDNTIPTFSFSVDKYQNLNVESITTDDNGTYLTVTDNLAAPAGSDVAGFISGNILIHDDLANFGGGLVTKSVGITNLGTTRKTNYSYVNPATNKTSGVSASSPSAMSVSEFSFPDNNYYGDEDLKKDARIEYRSVIYPAFSELMAKSRELPSPGVIYEYVTIQESIEDEQGNMQLLPTYSTYQHQVFEAYMVDVFHETFSDEIVTPVYTGDVTSETDKIRKRKITISDLTAQVGALKSITRYDNVNLDNVFENDRMISQTVNHYLYDNFKLIFDNVGSVVGEGKGQALDPYQLLSDDLANKYTSQGMLHESYVDSRYIRQEDYTVVIDKAGFPVAIHPFHLLGVISKRERFPMVQVGQTTTNFKTGITTTSQNLAFDFYSGAVTKTRTTDGYGNTFDSEVIPAYRKYGGPGGMGLAINDGKNMLTQTAANYTWKVDPHTGTKQSLISAGIQTWNDHWAYKGADGLEANAAASDLQPVWRKHESYSYNGGQSNLKTDNDGLVVFDPQSFQDFDHWAATGTEPGNAWQKNSEITLYDRYSHALEAADVNGNYAATKMDGDQEKVLSTIANAGYNEFAYAGAEDTESSGYFGGAVTKGASATKYTTTDDNDANVHTGWASLLAASGVKAFGFTATAKNTRQFKVSTWASQSDGVIKYKLNGGAEQSLTPTTKQADSWYLLTAYLPEVNANDQLEIWCEAGAATTYFDDFRVHPIDAPMTAYVYNNYDELAFVLDNNNLYTEYQYDAMGRLERTYRESFKYGRNKISEYEIKYAKSNQGGGN